MNASLNTHSVKDNVQSLSLETIHPDHNDTTLGKLQSFNTSQSILLPNRIVPHHPKAGLNPLVDAAGYLFSVIGKLKELTAYRQLNKLQNELIQEVNAFQEAVKAHGYNSELLVVCRYVLCATIDDVIYNTNWGGQGQWEPYCLLATFNQDSQQEDKFFTILERAIKEPALYIDLMELMYLCLSMGYKGQYRLTEHSHYQLEQITNNLFKHIRAFRGSFSKTLSPTPLKSHKPSATTRKTRALSIPFVMVVTASIIMTLFVSLGYLMDVISNEAYKNVAQLGNPVSQQNSA